MVAPSHFGNWYVLNKVFRLGLELSKECFCARYQWWPPVFPQWNA